MVRATQDFFWYAGRVIRLAFRNGFSWGRDQMISALMALLILFYQINAGVIKHAEANSAEWSIVWPYVILFAAFALFHVVRGAWQLDVSQRALIAELTAGATRVVDPLKQRVAQLAELKSLGLRLAHKPSEWEGGAAAWTAAVAEWTNTTHAYLKTCSAQAAVTFADCTGIMDARYMGVPAELQTYMGPLSRRIENLSKILDRPDVYLSWRRPAISSIFQT